MPNWCENELTLKGRREDIKAVLDYINDESRRDPSPGCIKDYWKFSFNKIVPEPSTFDPSEFNDNSKEPYWYRWRIKYWGTNKSPWVRRITYPDSPKRTGSIYFDTAWTPPIPIIIVLSVKFPKVLFIMKYWEMGNGFQGTYSIRGGTPIKDEMLKYRGQRGG